MIQKRCQSGFIESHHEIDSILFFFFGFVVQCEVEKKNSSKRAHTNDRNENEEWKCRMRKTSVENWDEGRKSAIRKLAHTDTDIDIC